MSKNIKKFDLLKTSFLLFIICIILSIFSPSSFAADIPLWTTNGVPICTVTNYQMYPQIVSAGDNGAIIVWEDYRTSPVRIYAQRVNGKGEVQWTSDGIVIANAVARQFSPKIASDGANGAIITWYENRTGDYNIYAQRIDGNGSLLWGANGIAICSASGTQQNPQIASYGTNGAMVVWEDNRSGNYDIYAQNVDGNGTAQWKADGVTVCAASGNQTIAQIASNSYNDASIIWKDNRSGNYDVYAQKLDSGGTAQWITDGVTVCAASNDQINAQLIIVGTKNTIITWQDNRSGNYDIYAQRLDSKGTVQWIKNGAAVCTSTYGQTYPQLAADGSDGAIITWTDDRTGTALFDIYAQKINSGGAVQWLTNGITICSSSNVQQNPKIISDGNNGAIITWEDIRSGYYDIYAQRVDGNGAIKDTTNGITICAASNNQEVPQIASDGANGAIITWYDLRSGTTHDIYAQRMIPLDNVYVSSVAGSDDTGNGTYDKPYKTIAKGLSVVDPGGTVHVATGEYLEHDIAWPNRNNITIRGAGSNETVISAEAKGRVINIPNAVSLTIEGVTIKNGLTADEGAGIRMASGGTLQLITVIVNDNRSTFTGDNVGCAIFAKNAYINAINCYISNNSWSYPTITAACGGGVGLQDSCIFNAYNCVFSNNNGGNGGGGVAFYSLGYPPIFNATNCRFLNNSASKSGSIGGGIAGNGFFKAVNCAFSGNQADYGGGVSPTIGELGGGTITATNCSFSNNISLGGKSIHINSDGGSAYFRNCILWGSTNEVYVYSGNKVTFEYTDLPSSEWGETGVTTKACISADPNFISTSESLPDFLKLQFSSPCINSGTFEGAPPNDMAGTPRPQPSINQKANFDMGCYEQVGELIPPTVSVGAPNESIVIDSGSKYEIIWSATDEGVGFPANDYINIFLITGEGNQWMTIATGLENNISGSSGIYTWEVNSKYASGKCRISIEAIDSNNNHGYDISDNDFQINDLLDSVHVSIDGNDIYPAGDGTASKPYKTIQRGLNKCAAGGSVRVASGTYQEHNIVWPNRNKIILTGEGRGLTTIDAQGLGRVIDVQYYVSPTIEGVTITNGSVEGNGGGIYLIASGLDLKNTVINNNRCTGSGRGGGLYTNLGYKLINIIDSTFSSNEAYIGGAIYAAGSSTPVTVKAENCIIKNNFASGNIGGVAANIFEADNCIIANNSAKDEVGGVYITGASGSNGSFTATNCTFYNTAKNNRSIKIGSGNSFIKNCIIWGSSDEVSYADDKIISMNFEYSDLPRGDWAGQTYVTVSTKAVISEDPLFISTDEASPNFLKLLVLSPCIDSGTSEGAPKYAIDRTPRPQLYPNGRFDMGVYEQGIELLSQVYVSESRGSDITGTGTSGSPFKTIRQALPYVSANGSISVEAGDYHEHDLIWPDRDNITLYGAGSGLTTIDADGSGRAIIIEFPISITIGGLTIANGHIYDNGGGIYADCNDLDLSDVVFTGNFASGMGGGLCAYNATTVKANDCIFQNNSTTIKSYGGLYVASSLEAMDCIFNGNIDGGAACGDYSHIENCIFNNNSGGYHSGLEIGGNSSVINCIFSSNSSAGTCGGLITNSKCNVINCTFLNNTSGGGNGALINGNTLLKNCIFWGSSIEVYVSDKDLTASFLYCDLPSDNWSSVNIGDGCISHEPQFISTDDTSPNFLKLGPGSPCIDAGTSEGAPAFDMKGTARDEGKGPDMGALELMISKPNIIKSSITLNGTPVSESKKLSKTPVMGMDIQDEYINVRVPTVEVWLGTINCPVIIQIVGTNEIHVTATPEIQIEEEGDYPISVRAVNAYGKIDELSNTDTLNYRVNLAITVKPKNIPNPFSPRKDGSTTIVYSLSKNADIKIAIYDITGRCIWTRKFASGTEGGKVNVNNVIWDGKTDFGDTAPNGAYIYYILSDNDLLAKAQMAIID